jgi:hypothetical protein
VPEQQLHGPEVLGAPVDQGCLGAALTSHELTQFILRYLQSTGFIVISYYIWD